MDRKKILITGGAGFIGSHTAVELYEAGYTPVIADNFKNSDPSMLQGIKDICQADIPCHIGDCTDKGFLSGVFQKEQDITGVIHFAAYKSVNESNQLPLMYYQNNLVSLLVLLETMIQQGVPKLVFSSSCTVYGSPDTIPVTEKAPFKETPSTYGKTKQLCENICEDVALKTKGIRTVLLRYFNPIGAHPSAKIGELPIGVPNNLVPFITQTACGRRKQLTIFGNDYQTPDGTCIRDYIHVVDLARAHIKAFEYLDRNPACLFEKINVGTGRGLSVLETVKAFERVNGLKLDYAFGPRRDGDVEAVYADAGRARQLLGWEAKLGIEEALRDAWRWQRHCEQLQAANPGKRIG